MTNLDDLLNRQVPPPEPVVAEVDWYYCLEEAHPGAPTLSSHPLSELRTFAVPRDVVGCPRCPSCGREVNAAVCAGQAPPDSIVQLQSRLDAM